MSRKIPNHTNIHSCQCGKWKITYYNASDSSIYCALRQQLEGYKLQHTCSCVCPHQYVLQLRYAAEQVQSVQRIVLSWEISTAGINSAAIKTLSSELPTCNDFHWTYILFSHDADIYVLRIYVLCVGMTPKHCGLQLPWVFIVLDLKVSTECFHQQSLDVLRTF